MFEAGSTNIVTEYFSYLESSYLVFFVSKFSYYLRKQIVNPRKVYAIDTGIIKVNSSSFSNDTGRKFENLIYLHLRRSFKDIYYFSERGECDFVVADRGKVIKCIHVCHTLNIDNREREIHGLHEAMDFFKLKNGILVTFDTEDKFADGDKVIEVVAASDFLSEFGKDSLTTMS